MNKIQLSSGNYYLLQFHNDKDNEWIVCIDRVYNSSVYGTFICTGKYSAAFYDEKRELGPLGSITAHRPATWEERRWLDVCIEKKRRVDKDEIPPLNYEIF